MFGSPFSFSDIFCWSKSLNHLLIDCIGHEPAKEWTHYKCPKCMASCGVKIKTEENRISHIVWAFFVRVKWAKYFIRIRLILSQKILIWFIRKIDTHIILCFIYYIKHYLIISSLIVNLYILHTTTKHSIR